MYFGLSEEQQSFQESIDKFLEDTVTVDALRAYRTDDNDNLRELVFEGLNDLGLSGLIVPEKYGGLGLDSLFATSVCESLGKGVAPYPFIGSFLLAPYLIKHMGSERQKEKYLPGIASGDIRFAVSLTTSNDRGTGFDDLNDYDNYLGCNGCLDGETLFVLDDIDSTHYLITDGNGYMHIVNSNAEGIEKVELRTVDVTSFVSELRMKNVETENDCVNTGNVFKSSSIDDAISLGRIALAANTLGASQKMLDRSVEYAKERKQFGRPIGSFQAVKHMCAQMASDLEPCYSMVWYAAHAFDHISSEKLWMACQTKAHLSEVGSSIAKTATEVHGGMGFTDELGLHYWFKRIGFNRQLLGSPDLLRERAAFFQRLDSKFHHKSRAIPGGDIPF